MLRLVRAACSRYAAAGVLQATRCLQHSSACGCCGQRVARAMLQLLREQRVANMLRLLRAACSGRYALHCRIYTSMHLRVRLIYVLVCNICVLVCDIYTSVDLRLLRAA